MVFSLIILGIKKAVDGFSNLCAFLLVKLGLWLPVVFCIVYLLACAVMQIKLQGAAVGLFLGGAIACTVIGGFLALKSYGDRAKSTRSDSLNSGYSSAPKHMQSSILDYPSSRDESNKVITSSFAYSERENDALNISEVEVPKMQVEETEIAPVERQRRSTTFEKLKERPYKYDDFGDLREKYFKTQNGDRIEEKNLGPQEAEKEKAAPLYSNWTSTKEGAAANRAVESESRGFGRVRHEEAAEGEVAASDFGGRRNEAARVPGNLPVNSSFRQEEPMIFATRRDPNVLVYEYSDRLDFYRKVRGGGVEFVERVMKR